MKSREFKWFIHVSLMLFLVLFPNSLLAEKPSHFSRPIKLINLETGYLLGGDQNIQIGIGQSGMGVAGRMQFTTDIMLDMLTFLNFQVKVGLLEDRDMIPALSLGFAYYNLVSTSYIVETAVREGFADEDMDLSSGLEIYYFFASCSKEFADKLRLHIGYQYRYLYGYLNSDNPVTLYAENDSIAVFLAVEQNAVHRCLMSALDFDLLDRFKMIFELGYDFSCERGRGGFAVRLGLLDSFAFQLGFLWPGIKLEEDFELPVLPHFSMLWRF